ncbi:hypothetical protein [Bacillus atrophaeus]|uniref:hypothetical protein n=1 Tax=Bacillus atrophaeus TaxID=1452 RepID=UPI003D1E5051
MNEQKLEIRRISYEVFDDYDPFTEEHLGKVVNGSFDALISKKNVAQVGSRQIDYANEVKLGYGVFGKETEEKIKEHLLAAYMLIAEGAKDYGLGS